MELRAFLLISASLAAASDASASPVLRYPLDERKVYSLKVGIDAPTTVVFPGPLTAMDGAGLSGKTEDLPGVLLSHQEGAPYFSVRALRPDAKAAANVMFSNRVYVFVFIADAEPDRTLTLYDRKEQPGGAPGASRRPERLLALLDQARNYDALAAQYPALVQGVERVVLQAESVQGPLSGVIEELIRFPDEDALVFRVRIANRAVDARRIDPAQLGVKVAGTVFPAALTDAPEHLLPGSVVRVHLIVIGNPDGSPARLSVSNSFSLAFPPAGPNG